MSRLSPIPILLGAATLAALMSSTPNYDRVFRPFSSITVNGSVAHGRLFDARFSQWQTADRVVFERAGHRVEVDTQGIFLIVDFNVLNVRESVRLSTAWLGRSGRRYEQTDRINGLSSALNVRQFHPGLDDTGRAVFELPPDEIEGGSLLLSLKGPNVLDSELLLQSPQSSQGKPAQHDELLRLAP